MIANTESSPSQMYLDTNTIKYINKQSKINYIPDATEISMITTFYSHDPNIDEIIKNSKFDNIGNEQKKSTESSLVNLNIPPIRTTSSNSLSDIDEIIKSSEFEFNIEREQQKSIKSALIYIFSYFESLVDENKFTLCNRILSEFNTYKFDTTVLLCLLTASLPYKERMVCRESLYFKTKNIIFNLYSREEAEQLIIGLE